MTCDDDLQLGPCCICEQVSPGVRNILTFSWTGPIKGRGWGCVVCGLPADGAVAVLCDPCWEAYQADESKLKHICTGYPAHDGRTSVEKWILMRVEHDHDLSKHSEITQNDAV